MRCPRFTSRCWTLTWVLGPTPTLAQQMGERGAPSEVCHEVEHYPLTPHRRDSLLHVRQERLVLELAEVDFDIRERAGDCRICQ